MTSGGAIPIVLVEEDSGLDWDGGKGEEEK